jgi:hypothetical protein
VNKKVSRILPTNNLKLNNNQNPTEPMEYNWLNDKMKKTILFVVAMFVATLTFAQQQLATLNHNDSITVYYGPSALQQAHNAAISGDIITLSPGSFNSVNITKAVSIRGAGMFSDTAAGTAPTILIDNFTVTINNDSLHTLYMEGIYMAGAIMYYSKIFNPQFVRCYFRQIAPTQSNTMENACFINCVMETFENGFDSDIAYSRNAQFVNSVILWLRHYGNPSLINCVAQLYNGPDVLNHVSVNNSIVYWNGISDQINAYTSFNSIGINIGTSTNRSFFNATGLPNHNLHNFYGFASVFKNFRGSYSDGITFELLDTVAATCLGSDGTQVGIYGGIMPFDPSVRNPLIKKCNVASRSTADGKLAVDIEIVSE